ncbi:MAG TPA: hypothetical protein VIQ23_17855 [Hanamia sp.]|jgi:hypothetical protein
MKKYMSFRYSLVAFFVACSFGSIAQVQSSKINIVDFSVVKTQDKVSINWSTDHTTPTNYFELEKSNDGKKFKTIAYILGPDPSEKDCDCYGSFDKITAVNKELYYRLKHIDKDGFVEFSEIKMLALNK